MAKPAFRPLYALLLLLAGCATRIGEPMHMGQGIYTVSGSASSIMASSYDVVIDLERHASGFCASSGSKALQVVKVDTASPEGVHFPEGRLEFRCVLATAA